MDPYICELNLLCNIFLSSTSWTQEHPLKYVVLPNLIIHGAEEENFNPLVKFGMNYNTEGRLWVIGILCSEGFLWIPEGTPRTNSIQLRMRMHKGALSPWKTRGDFSKHLLSLRKY